jgi:hypothetical protein
MFKFGKKSCKKYVDFGKNIQNFKIEKRNNKKQRKEEKDVPNLIGRGSSNCYGFYRLGCAAHCSRRPAAPTVHCAQRCIFVLYPQFGTHWIT